MMNVSMFVQNQLLATKFYIPVAPRTLIPRPRLSILLDESLKRPFTLVCAPAGFGKTTLLATWAQSLLANHSLVAWVSLDEEDNDIQMFWTYVLSALAMQQSERFTPLLRYLQSPQSPSIKYVLAALSNLVWDSSEHFVLILDDYHTITEQEVHNTLSYLLEHLPPQLHVLLATRTDPSLQLSLLRARGLVLEVRTNQLRCTIEETRTIFRKITDVDLPEETIQQVTTRTEGWLVGLQLLGLSLPGCADPRSLLEEISGDQRYILDYLTEEVLRRQTLQVQTFLLSTCILERFTASLCDAVLERTDSQQMLQWLEQANLFVVPLDSKRQWYRYHALFAEALRSQVEWTKSDWLPFLHYRASIWYAQHDQTTDAILHAFRANQWQWAADLIEQKSLQLMTLTWGAGQRAMVMLQGWIKQLPAEVMHSRPRLCLACSQLLWAVTPHEVLDAWLDEAEWALNAALTVQTRGEVLPTMHVPQARQDQENLLGEVITFRAVVRSHEEDGQAVLPLCQQALALLSADNIGARTFVAWAQLRLLYASGANDAEAAIETGLQASSLAQAAEKATLAIGMMGATALYMIGTGRLREIHQLTQRAMQLAIQPGEIVLPDRCWPAILQAEVLREWNQLDAALKLIEEAILLIPQTAAIVSITYAVYGYVILMRIALSRGEMDRAHSALQEFERITMNMNRPLSLHYYSLFTTVDQIRFWLACGELEQAKSWAQKLDLGERHGTAFAHEREEVAHTRIFLAMAEPIQALQRLSPALQRATAGKRWSHVIEIRLLQALAHQMLHQEIQALDALSEAVRLAEPEGFIHSFVDEGPPMAALLSKLWKYQGKERPAAYLDKLLAAFPQQNKPHRYPAKQSRRRIE